MAEYIDEYMIEINYAGLKEDFLFLSKLHDQANRSFYPKQYLEYIKLPLDKKRKYIDSVLKLALAMEVKDATTVI